MEFSKFKNNLLFILLVLVFPYGSTFAIDFEDAAFPELIVSNRALGMGNAYISRVQDQSSAFYNPAGFGSVRQAHIHFSQFHVETNRGWLRSTSSGKFLDVPGNLPKGFSLDGARELLDQNPGNIHHSRFQAMPNFTARHFSMGYMYVKTARSTVGMQENAPFEFAQRRDHGPYTAVNFSLMGGILKFGANAVWLSRKQTQGQAPSDVELQLDRQDFSKGQGLIIISGTRLTLPVRWLPTLSAKMNNTLNQRFTRSSGYNDAPDTIANSLDIGFSVTPRVSNMSWLHLEMNFRDATGEYSGVSTTRKLALGMELDVARRFFFRLGYGDGFGSFGMGVRSRDFQFDITSYAVDTTSSEFRGKEDRRFALSVSSGL